MRVFSVALLFYFMVSVNLSASTLFLAEDPANIRFLDLYDCYNHVYHQFDKQTSLLGSVRRKIVTAKAKRWGLVTPDAKGKTEIAYVVKTSKSDTFLNFVMVLRGEVKPGKIIKRMVKKHKNHFKRNKRAAPVPTEITVEGKKATQLSYVKREGIITLVGFDNTFIMASTAPNDLSLLEKTIKVLQNPELINKKPVTSLEFHYQPKMTGLEKTRTKHFLKLAYGKALKKMRDNFKKLYNYLEDKISEDEMKTSSEKINELFVAANDFDITVNYSLGKNGKETYGLRYIMRFSSAKEAQKMKELLLEKAFLYKTNVGEENFTNTLDLITLDKDKSNLIITVVTYEEKEVYNFAYTFLAILFDGTVMSKFYGL
ncbi:hypothetical protein ACFL35_06085 [Candidatus Riflebacteria bacterium]